MVAKEKLHPLLDAFKERMRIFHSGEDENLSRMLESSQAVVYRLIGNREIHEYQIRELILERARYAYNDQVEFFYENFKVDLLALSLDGLEMEDMND